jgi:hypothetical protein
MREVLFCQVGRSIKAVDRRCVKCMESPRLVVMTVVLRS